MEHERIEVSSVPPKQLANVPAFPPVVMKLLSLMASEQSSVASIAACIAADPTLSGRILKRANSADIARHLPARDVVQAILTLGLDRTREITLTTATMAYLGSALKTEQLQRCWRHTVACAMASAEIARACDLSPAEPYTAGLLHDIGRLGLLAAYPMEYEQTVADAARRGMDLLQLEREYFGVDHTEAGRWLAQRWNLPETIALIAGAHHDAPVPGTEPLAIAQVACRLADVLGYCVGEAVEPPEFDAITATLPDTARNRLWRKLSALENDILQQMRFFGGTEDQTPAQRLTVTIEESEAEDLSADFLPPVPRRTVAGWVMAAIGLLLIGSAALFVLRP